SSSLLSWSWIQSLRNITLNGLPKRILPRLVKRNRIHGYVANLPVIDTVAFTNEIDALLRTRNNCDHPIGAVHDAVNSERIDLQAGFASRQVLGRWPAVLILADQWIERVTPRNTRMFHSRCEAGGGCLFQSGGPYIRSSRRNCRLF